LGEKYPACDGGRHFLTAMVLSSEEETNDLQTPSIA
jgi:hypothetical protein